jgi:hypothetical protein
VIARRFYDEAHGSLHRLRNGLFAACPQWGDGCWRSRNSRAPRPAVAKALFDSVVREVIAQNAQPGLRVRREEP